MQSRQERLNELHKLLESFIEKSFPKTCRCGRIYANLREFLSRTKEMSASGSLLAPDDYEGTRAIDLTRNCACGSTIMVAIHNRRDMSKEGIRLRKLFGELLDELIATGLEHDVARRELLKVLHEKDSEAPHGKPRGILAKEGEILSRLEPGTKICRTIKNRKRD